jgi:uncharacterized membrane protein
MTHFQHNSNNERPLIKIKKDKIDWTLDIIAMIALLFIWIYSIIHFYKLPERIPTHFNIKGEIDDYGTKYTLWILPLITTFLFVLFRALYNYPHKFNYIVNITIENAEKQYRLALRIMRIILMNLSLLFGYIVVKAIDGAYQKSSSLDWWFIPLLEISVITPVIYMAIASTFSKKKK